MGCPWGQGSTAQRGAGLGLTSAEWAVYHAAQRWSCPQPHPCGGGRVQPFREGGRSPLGGWKAGGPPPPAHCGKFCSAPKENFGRETKSAPPRTRGRGGGRGSPCPYGAARGCKVCWAPALCWHTRRGVGGLGATTATRNVLGQWTTP